MTPRCNVGRGITGAVRYALGEGRGAGNDNLVPGEGSRVEWIGGVGFGFAIRTSEDADLARRIMEFDGLNQGSRTKRCEKDAVHLSLSWRPGQKPTRAEMEEAARGALTAMGMGNAKALFVCHNDEAYSHVHIVASRINPDTGRAYDLKGNFLALSAWAYAWERDHGGVICLGRENANALRGAIDERDSAKVLAALTTQRATFTEADLERALAKQIADPAERSMFADAVIHQPDVVALRDVADGPTTRFTSKDVLEAEERVLEAVAGLVRSRVHRVDPTDTLAKPEFASMTAEQLTAVRHATTASGIALIDGQAGTGKSFTVGAIRQVYARAGYEVIGLAPTNALADDMRDSGFARAVTLHSELFRLNSGRGSWTDRTVLMLDEAAMVDTKLMAELTRHADEVGAKLILVGDDRQLSSIDRGGMFGVLKDRYGAAELAQVHRQTKNDDRRAAELMAQGNFDTALRMFDAKGAIHWQRSQEMARAELVRQWAKDSAAAPTKSRFVFAYANSDVNQLNADLRAVRKARGELKGADRTFTTRYGVAAFAESDRIQITGTDKACDLTNGAAGTIEKIAGDTIAVRLDGRYPKLVTFDAREFPDFRHGYAGTIYKGQGRTLDQTYLYHTEHWRSAASYVGLTRHRDKAGLFVARNTAADVKQLARQMARVDERRAASHFHRVEVSGFEPGLIVVPASRVKDPQMQQGLPNHDLLLRQADIEAQRLRELQAHEERAQAFRRAKQIEFDEAKTKPPGRGQEAEAREGDISSAPARYAIALGENYIVRDPYGSLARAAMSEYAMFHRNQEKMRGEMAKERNPDKRRIIELRRNIEACDYMALTSDRLAGISVAIVGRKDAPQAVLDHERAADYRAQAAALRVQRTELIENIETREPMPAVTPSSSPSQTPVSDAVPGGAQVADVAPASAAPQPAVSTHDQVSAAMVSEGTTSIPIPTMTASPGPEVSPADIGNETARAVQPSGQEPTAEPSRAPQLTPEGLAPDAVAPTPEPFTLSPGVSRGDVIPPPPAFPVVVAKDAPVAATAISAQPFGQAPPSEPVPQPERAAPDAVTSPPPLTPAPFMVSPALSRPDIVAAPPTVHVTIDKDKANNAPSSTPDAAPSVPPERQKSEMPWMDALRRRAEEAVPTSRDALSEQAVARLAKRLEQGANVPEAANDQERDDPGPEPDL